MSTEANKAVVRRFFEEVYNNHRLDLCDEIQDPEYAAFEKEWLRTWLAAFPDLHMTVDDIMAEGDKVAATITMRGTHQGMLQGEVIQWLTGPVPATGRQVEVRGIFVYLVLDGKLQRTGSWGVADWLGLLRQLGVVPMPEQPGMGH
jgi:predicted ester cyclase